MATTYFLAPNARWQGRDLTGQPIIGGKLYTYENQTTTPKATYQDKDGNADNTNPVILDDKGEANIYWADDNLYSIKLTTAEDDLVYTQDDYPWVANNQDQQADDIDVAHNLIRNPQFSFWSNSTDFPNIKTAQNNYDYCADDWLYSKTCADSIVEIKRNTLDLGQAEIEGSPTYYLSYECSNLGSSTETNTHLYQRYDGVQTLQNKPVQYFIYARCRNMASTTLNVKLVQNFGTGGSPSSPVDNNLLNLTLTTSWQKFELPASVVLNSITGKTLGTNGDDALILDYVFPNNQIAYIDICTSQFIPGTVPLSFDFLSDNDQYKRLDKAISESTFYTGDVKFTLRNTPDPGWLMCDDGTIGNSGSGSDTATIGTKALFTLLWANIANTYAPILNSDGTIGTRGATAEADYNALKRLTLTRTVGRIIGTAGQAYLASPVVFNDTTDALTIVDASAFATGTPVQLTTSGSLASPLLSATTYYSIYVDATTIQVAASLSDAVAGIPIDLTTTGSGISDVHVTYATWSPGQYTTNPEDHLITVPELPSHNHPGSSLSRDIIGSVGAADSIAVNQGQSQSPLSAVTVAAQGGNTPFSIMQPTVFLYSQIKL